MLAGKTLLDFTNLFSPNAYRKNNKIIYKDFKDKYGRRSKSGVQIKKKHETRNYRYDLMSEKYKKTCSSSAVAMQICAINAGIKKYKSIIKKKKKKHDKI